MSTDKATKENGNLPIFGVMNIPFTELTDKQMEWLALHELAHLQAKNRLANEKDKKLLIEQFNKHFKTSLGCL